MYAFSEGFELLKSLRSVDFYDGVWKRGVLSSSSSVWEIRREIRPFVSTELAASEFHVPKSTMTRVHDDVDKLNGTDNSRSIDNDRWHKGRHCKPHGEINSGYGYQLQCTFFIITTIIFFFSYFRTIMSNMRKSNHPYINSKRSANLHTTWKSIENYTKTTHSCAPIQHNVNTYFLLIFERLSDIIRIL